MKKLIPVFVLVAALAVAIGFLFPSPSSSIGPATYMNVTADLEPSSVVDPGDTVILDVDVLTDCFDAVDYIHAQPFVDEPSGSGITFDPPTYTKNSTFNKRFDVIVPEGTPGGQYFIDVKVRGCDWTDVRLSSPVALTVTGPGPPPTTTPSPTVTSTPTPTPTPTPTSTPSPEVEFGTPSVSDNGIEITYTPHSSRRCEKILMIQAVCRTALLPDDSVEPFMPGDAWPAWGEDSKISDGKADSKDANTINNCTVDYIQSESDPYYNGDDPKDHGDKGTHNAQIEPATVSGAPNYATEAFDNLETKFGQGVNRVILEFETCSFCAEGEDAGEFYGCLMWKMEQEKGKTGTASTAGTSAIPSSNFQSALTLWGSNHGFTLPTPTPTPTPP